MMENVVYNDTLRADLKVSVEVRARGAEEVEDWAVVTVAKEGPRLRVPVRLAGLGPLARAAGPGFKIETLVRSGG